MTEEKKTEEKEEIKLEGKMAEFVDWIETISVLELSKLVEALEDRLGVSAAAPAAVAAAPAAGGGEEEEEKTEFDVVLTDVGGQKIKVIKELRSLTSLGLKDAKKLVDSAPNPVKEAVSKEDAEEAAEKLKAVGATVEIK